MPDADKVRELLEGFKTCPREEISRYFSPALRLYRFLTHDHRLELSQSIYKWAAEQTPADPVKQGYAEFLVGICHFIDEKHEEALKCLMKARKEFEELQESDGLGLTDMLIGATYRTLCNFDLGLKTLWEGFALLKSSGRYPTFLAACANSMANINLELRDFEEARKMFQIAFEESEKEDDFYFKIYALHGLGKVSMLQENMAAAQEFFEESLRLAEENRHPMQTANSLSELANLHFHLSDNERSEELNSKALMIRREHHLTGGEVTSLIRLGELYIAQARWNEALAVLNEGLTKAEDTKLKPKMYQVHHLLSEIYHELHQAEVSLHHYKLFHNLREQVEQEDGIRKLADARLVFEAEQTKKENVVIRKQKAEIQRRNSELQQTIDELTITRVSRKAKAFTLGIAIVLFIVQDFVLGVVLRKLPSDNYFLSLGVKMFIIFSLSPINGGIERYLLKRVIKRKMAPVLDEGQV